jgi:DNA-binding CsgD family transcriptional regulator
VAPAPWAEAVRLGAAAGQAWVRGDADRWRALLERQRREATGNRRAEMVALTFSGLLWGLSGYLTRAREDLAAAEAGMRSARIAALGPRWEQAALVCDWLAGDWASAEARSARQEALPPVPASLTLGLRLELLRARGDDDAAAQAARRLAAESASPLAAWALAGTIRQPAVAMARLRDAASAAQRNDVRAILPLLLHRLAEVARRSGRERVATQAWAEFRELDLRDPLPQVLAGLAEAHATGAAGPARVAQGIAESQGMAALAIECLDARGRLGDDPDHTLRAARERWQAIGAGKRARDLSVLLGEPAGEAPVRLTPREHELVSLIQRGSSNRKIGAAMNLSVKTVEAYLTRIYAKTACTSRLELALAAAQGHILRAAAPGKQGE